MRIISSLLMATAVITFPVLAFASHIQSMSTENIKSIQRELADEGFYKSNIDGVWGRQSDKALRAFQADENLPVTGQLDERTQDELDVNLKEGGRYNEKHHSMWNKADKRDMKYRDMNHDRNMNRDGMYSDMNHGMRHDRTTVTYDNDRNYMNSNNNYDRNYERGAVYYYNDNRRVALSTSEIQALQQSLRDMGFYKKTVTGTWTPETVAALAGYQDSKGLAVTGQLDEVTRDRIGLRIQAMDQVD